MAQGSAVSVDEKKITENFSRKIGTAQYSIDACR